MAKEILIDLSKGPDPLPKAGDAVNHVHNGNKIAAAKVATVIEKSDGRAITIDGVTGRKEEPLRIVYRPKEAMADNTWHWPAKAAAMLTLLAMLALALVMPAQAALPTYHTSSGYGNSSGPATVILPSDPNSQIRLVTILFTSDNAGAQFSFTSGSTAYSIQFSNTVSSVTNLIDSTNGLAGASILILQHNGLCYTDSVSSFGTYISGTNTSGYVTNQAFVVTPAAFSLGASTWVGTAGDNIYLMTSPSTWYAGATTNEINGDDIYSGNYGRPVEVQLGPATATNRLNTVSAHYDSAAQF